MADLFDEKDRSQPFESYDEYMEYLFACVNEGMNRYLANLKKVYATRRRKNSSGTWIWLFQS